MSSFISNYLLPSTSHLVESWSSGTNKATQDKKRVADTEKRDKDRERGRRVHTFKHNRCTRMAILGSSSNARCLLSSGSSLSHPLLCARACRGEFLPLSCRQLQQSHKLLGLNWGSDNRRQQEEERGALTSDRQQFSSTSIRRRRYCSFLAPCCCSSAPTEASVSNGKHQTPPPNGSSAEFPYNC